MHIQWWGNRNWQKTGAWWPDNPSYLKDSGPVRASVSKNKVDNNEEKCWHLAFTCADTHKCVNLHVPVYTYACVYTQEINYQRPWTLSPRWSDVLTDVINKFCYIILFPIVCKKIQISSSQDKNPFRCSNYYYLYMLHITFLRWIHLMTVV